MSPADFRNLHGDPAEWCGPEIDEYLEACDEALPTPTPQAQPAA
ncbi:hypothetical protein [Streptomyces sp. NPDC058745]